MTLPTEQPSAKGHLTITALHPDGRREVLSSKKNQIVNGFLTAAAELITQRGGLDPGSRAVASMWLEASDSALQPVNPIDTAPEGIIVKRAVFTDSDVDVNVGNIPGLVEFRAVLDHGEANGSKIRAASLYTRGDAAAPGGTFDPANSGASMVARQLFGSIYKEPGFALEFTWRIQFKLKATSSVP